MVPLEELIRKQLVWHGGPVSAGMAAAVVRTGFSALDAELPGGGWPVGALVELLCHAEGVGELQPVLPALSALTAAGQRVAWLAPPHLPYAPALRAAGVCLEGLTVIRAPGRRDALWAAEQALRSRAFHALLLWLPQASYAELQRLAVAAQGGPGFALAFRRPEEGSEATPAVLRLALAMPPVAEDPLFAVRILKRRGPPLTGPIFLPRRISPFSSRPYIESPARALGRAPFSAVAAPGAAARACTA